MFFFLSIILHFLLLWNCSSSASATSNATSIYEVLRDHGLPMGIFPKGVKDFNVADDGRFWVQLDQACNAKFEDLLHYDRNVSGLLSYGMIDGLTGLKAQDLFLWLQVMSIRVDVPTTGLIYFNASDVYKQFSLSLFESPPDCVAVGSQEVAHDATRGGLSKGRFGRLRYQHDQGTSGKDVL